MEISLEQLAELLCKPRDTTPCAPCAGGTSRYVIVRGEASGLFAGVLASHDGRTVELTECRHLWYWKGAANSAELALSGTSRPTECKFVAPVAHLTVLDAIEIIDCTAAAETSIRAVAPWSVR